MVKITKEEFERTGPHYCGCVDKEIIEWNEIYRWHGIPKYRRGHNSKGKNNSFYGKHHTIESIEKIKKPQRGNIPWNNGIKCPQISKSLIGKKKSPETGKNISKAKLGKPSKRKGMHQPQTTGDKNPNWKGGITPLLLQIRMCFEYRIWRSEIFKRDNYTCIVCSKQGYNLNAHHYPISFSTIMEKYNIDTFEKAVNCIELWDINNGVTLCEDCHRKTIPNSHNQSFNDLLNLSIIKDIWNWWD